MSFRLRHFLIRFLLPITWKKSSAQKVRVLQEFAQTELDSAWQSIYAIERVENSGLRSLLFQHAMEELFHSDLFRRLASHKSSELPSAPLTRREPLLFLEKGAEKSAVEFFAYLAIGDRKSTRLNSSHT